MPWRLFLLSENGTAGPRPQRYRGKAGTMDRRDFLKRAGAAGGAALLSNLLPRGVVQAAEKSERTGIADSVLAGVCDLHIHATPDTKARTVNELELCRRAQTAGYRAVLFKSNIWSCQDRAYLLQEAVPGCGCFGSLVMNLAFGEKVNVYAAEQALKTTGNLCPLYLDAHAECRLSPYS